MKKIQQKDELNINRENFILKSSKNVASKYLKIQEIGIGTFSKVYRVQNKTNYNVCACKEISKEKLADFSKFINEINILSKCDHPNIIKLYEVFEDSKHINLIMEECTGGELFQRILDITDNGEKFSEKEVAVIFKQLMSAVCYCHNQGICHRDLKPENILFLNKEKDSPIKVIDFGISKIFGEIRPLMKNAKQEKNTMSARVGTAYYISPEVLQGNYDHKCDIWSCGVILYLLLCGYPPFDGETENDIYKAISKKKFTFPEEEWKDISDEAKDLIKHMICEPDKRYNAESVLNHVWLEKLAPNAKESLSKLNIENLREYKNSYKLKKVGIFFIASRLGEDEVKGLKSIFEEMDVNKDGTLSLEEFKNGLIKLRETKNVNITDDEIEKIFSSIDTNNSKKLEYSEFIAASMEQKTYLRAEKLLDLFQMIDSDGSGKISKKEVKKALKDEKMEEELLNKIIDEFDLNQDGEIDFTEFVTNMTALSKKEEEVQETNKPNTGKKGHK